MGRGWGAIVVAAGLAACAGGGSGNALPAAVATAGGTTLPVALAVSTSALAFTGSDVGPTTLPLTVTYAAPPGTSGAPLGAAAAAGGAVAAGLGSATPGAYASVAPVAAVADAAIVGLSGAGGSLLGTNYSGAQYLGVVRYAAGTTTVQFTLGGLSSSVAVTAQTCGRPDGMMLGTVLVAPAPGARAVATTTNALFAVIATPFNAVISLRARVLAPALDVANVPFVAATFPPGVPMPTPVPLPGVTAGTFRADLPAGVLAAGTTYRVQFVDDVCQPPFIAGSFST